MQTITLGKTANSEYKLKGSRVYRRIGNAVQFYGDLESFIDELMVGAMGGGWRETPEGKAIINRTITKH